MIAISLLICTRDRGPSLDRALASVTLAAGDGAGVEVVVVDNGSTDDTPARLAAWRAAQRFPVILVDEPRPGLARARNAGLARASGAIVAMTDDDCVLDAGFFAMLADRFAQVAGPIVIGGRILLGDPADLPVTIKLEDHALAAAADAFPGGFVMGANLAFTRDVPARLGPFDERFGAGARFRAAEDTDLLFRALGAGIPVRYDPHVVVAHHHGRRTPGQLRRLLAGYAYGDGALYAKHRRDPRIRAIVRQDLASAAREVRRGGVDPRSPRSLVFRLVHVGLGATAYLLACARRRPAAAPLQDYPVDERSGGVSQKTGHDPGERQPPPSRPEAATHAGVAQW